LFPSTTTTRVSSAWVASISIFLAILSIHTSHPKRAVQRRVEHKRCDCFFGR